MDSLPPLSSADLEALFKEPAFPGGYQDLEETAAWLLDPSPAESHDGVNGSAGAPSVSPTGVAGMPAEFLFGAVDPLAVFLDSGAASVLPPVPTLPGVASLPAMPPVPLPASTLAGIGEGSSGELSPPAMGRGGAATDSSGAMGSGTTSGGSAGMLMGVAPAAATSAPAPRGKGGKKELSEEQKERIKAKNRRAQARYREKKKAEASAAEAEFHSTVRELERLRLENSHLQEQQMAMDKVLNVREFFFSMLEAGKASQEEDAASAAAAAKHAKAASEAKPPPCGCPSAAQCTCMLPNGSAAKLAAQQLTICHSVALADDAAPAGPEGGSPLGRGQCPFTGLSLSQIAELKKTPPEQLQRTWRGIAQRLAHMLQQLESARSSQDPSLAARAEQLERDVETTLREGQAFCFEHAVYQPTNVQKLFAASLDDGRSNLSAEDLHHWEAVAGSLSLTEQQLERLEAARTRFLASIADVCAERRAIFERLQVLNAEIPTSLRVLQQATAAWLKVHEATAELTANMNQEHCVCMTFLRDAFGYTLTPVQKAAAIVKSFPYFPDMYSISSVALKATHHEALVGNEPRRMLEAGPVSA